MERFNPILGVGYAPELPAVGFSTRLADGSTVLTPDPTFLSRRARVSVVGSARGEKHQNEAGAVVLDALFPITGRTSGNYPRFRFFSAAGGESFDSISGHVSFTMPALATTGLTFVGRRINPGGAEADAPPIETNSAPFTLSLGNVDGPRLQRGVYVVALAESSSDKFSSWNRYTIAGQQAGWNIPGADFAYVILKIDYAS